MAKALMYTHTKQQSEIIPPNYYTTYSYFKAKHCQQIIFIKINCWKVHLPFFLKNRKPEVS